MSIFAHFHEKIKQISGRCLNIPKIPELYLRLEPSEYLIDPASAFLGRRLPNLMPYLI
jgi:hypothetical protein